MIKLKESNEVVYWIDPLKIKRINEWTNESQCAVMMDDSEDSFDVKVFNIPPAELVKKITDYKINMALLQSPHVDIAMDAKRTLIKLMEGK